MLDNDLYKAHHRVEGKGRGSLQVFGKEYKGMGRKLGGSTCIYVYIYICICTYKYIFIRAHMYLHIYVCIYKRTQAYLALPAFKPSRLKSYQKNPENLTPLVAQ